MRILLIPRIDERDVDGDSGFTVSSRVIEAFNRYGKKTWFYVLVPRGVKNVEKVLDDYDNVTVVYENRDWSGMSREYGLIDCSVLKNNFATDVGKYQVDVVFNAKPEIMNTVMYTVTDMYALIDKRARPVFVGMMPYVPQREQKHLLSDSRVIGWAMSVLLGKVCVLTELEMKDFITYIEKYLSASGIRGMKNNVVLAYQGFEPSIIDKWRGKVEKSEKFRLFSSGVTYKNKGWSFVFRLFETLYKMGYDFEFRATTPHKRIFDAEARNVYERSKSIIDFKFGASRDDYVKTLFSSHCWVSASQEERTGIKWLEMAYSGVPGIVNRMDWSEEIFGRNYQLMYKNNSLEDAIDKIKWVYENYDEAVAISEDVSRQVKENRSIKNYVVLMHKLLLDEYNQMMRNRLMSDSETYSRLFSVVVESFGGSEFTLEEFAERVRNMSDKGLVIEKRRAMAFKPTVWDVYQWLKNRMGCIDKLDGEESVLMYNC